jgi:GxxExxY protein
VPGGLRPPRGRPRTIEGERRYRICYAIKSTPSQELRASNGKTPETLAKSLGIADAGSICMSTDTTRDPETYRIIGAAMAVHSELGCGFLEKVYRLALGIEFAERGIVFKREVELPINYKQHLLPTSYQVDFICFGGVVVEVKALSALGNLEVAQLLNYLKASRIRRGLLINFGASSLQYQPVVWG